MLCHIEARLQTIPEHRLKRGDMTFVFTKSHFYHTKLYFIFSPQT